MPPNRKLIGAKCVFKIKRDNTYRSHLVALGYTQIAGVDFTDNFSPAVGDTTLRITLTLWMYLKLDLYQIDVETIFFEGVLEPHECVYLECPDGMKLGSDVCLEVRKSLYGLVISARILGEDFLNI